MLRPLAPECFRSVFWYMLTLRKPRVCPDNASTLRYISPLFERRRGKAHTQIRRRFQELSRKREADRRKIRDAYKSAIQDLLLVFDLEKYLHRRGG
jgi:hypothetical protein